MSSSAFVHSLPLKVSQKQEKILDKRFNAARQLYNVCLAEGLKRLKLTRESKNWQITRKIKIKSKASKLFRQAQKEQNLSDYDLQAFAIKCKNSCHFKQHLDADVTQKIATKAFGAIAQYMYKKRGRPRFKPINQLKSIEGKSNKQGIRFKKDKIIWGKEIFSPIFDKRDKHAVEAQALLCKTKYVRLLFRNIKGKRRYYAQLIQEGMPKQKYITGNSKVGLDIGPSSIAFYSNKKSSLEPFCANLKSYEKVIAAKQRLLDRSKRATNPDNFNKNGTIRSESKRWKFSNRYKQIQSQISEQQRRLAQSRKCEQGALANRILRIGKEIKTEKLSYRSFQRLWGKAIGKRAPGMFMEILRRKAERAGGKVIEFPTKTTCLSQVCHGCGAKNKKELSVRWHECECGVGPVQRDLYSAFLASCVNLNMLDINLANQQWSGAKLLLEQAISSLNKSANGGLRLSSFGLSKASRQSASSVKDGSMLGDVADVVDLDVESKLRAAKNQVV